MYALAYALLPATFASLQAELDRTLGPFRRGGPGDFPPDMLAFDDVTGDLRRLHRATFRLERSGKGGLGIGGDEIGPSSHLLDFGPMLDVMQARGLTAWTGRLDEIEPDFDAFARRFSALKGYDPATGRYGQWLNPLGRWD